MANPFSSRLGGFSIAVDLDLSQAKRKLSEFGRQLKITSRIINKDLHVNMEKLDSVIGVTAVTTGALTSAFVALTASLTASIVAFSKFEQIMANVQSVVQGTETQLRAMSDAALKLGPEMNYSATVAADSLYYLGSAGYNAQQVMNTFPSVLTLARATMSNLSETSETLVNTINAFKMSTTEANRIANVFAATIGSSQATLTKMRVAMGYVAPIAHMVGMSVEEASAAIGVLTSRGLEASMIGTGLRMSLTRLAAPTRQATETLKELGLSAADVNPKFHKLADIIDLLRSKGAGLKELSGLVGVRAATTLSNLLIAGSTELRRFQKEITGTEQATKMANIQMDTIQATIGKLIKRVEVLIIKFGELFKEDVQTITKYVTKIIDFFEGLDDTWAKLIKNGTLFVLGITALGAAISALMLLVSSLMKAYIYLRDKQAANIAITKTQTAANNELAASFANVVASASRASMAMGNAQVAAVPLTGTSARSVTTGRFTSWNASNKFMAMPGVSGMVPGRQQAEIGATAAGRAMYGKPGYLDQQVGMTSPQRYSSWPPGGPPSRLSKLKAQLSSPGAGMGLGTAAMIGGGMMIPSENKYVSGFGKVLAGAGMGAMIGSVVPGVGTAIGATAGAIIGTGAAISDQMRADADKDKEKTLKRITENTDRQNELLKRRREAFAAAFTEEQKLVALDKLGMRGTEEWNAQTNKARQAQAVFNTAVSETNKELTDLIQTEGVHMSSDAIRRMGNANKQYEDYKSALKDSKEAQQDLNDALEATYDLANRAAQGLIEMANSIVLDKKETKLLALGNEELKAKLIGLGGDEDRAEVMLAEVNAKKKIVEIDEEIEKREEALTELRKFSGLELDKLTDAEKERSKELQKKYNISDVNLQVQIQDKIIQLEKELAEYQEKLRLEEQTAGATHNKILREQAEERLKIEQKKLDELKKLQINYAKHLMKNEVAARSAEEDFAHQLTALRGDSIATASMEVSNALADLWSRGFIGNMDEIKEYIELSLADKMGDITVGGMEIGGAIGAYVPRFTERYQAPEQQILDVLDTSLQLNQERQQYVVDTAKACQETADHTRPEVMKRVLESAKLGVGLR